jgi:hypothetical protein
MAGKLYTIIEEESVTEALFLAVQQDRRVEDIFDALLWRIARDPTCGTEVEDKGTNFRLVKSVPLKKFESPYLLLRYRLGDQDDSIVVDWIKVLPYDVSLARSPPEFDLN